MPDLCKKDTEDLLCNFPRPDTDLCKTFDWTTAHSELLGALFTYSKEASNYQPVDAQISPSMQRSKSAMYAQCLGVEEYGGSTGLSTKAHEALKASQAFADVPDLNVNQLVEELQRKILSSEIPHEFSCSRDTGFGVSHLKEGVFAGLLVSMECS